MRIRKTTGCGVADGAASLNVIAASRAPVLRSVVWSLGILGFAVTERPVFPDDFDEIDEEILRLEPWFLRQQLDRARVEITFLFRLSPRAQCDLHQHDVIGPVDAEISGIVDDAAGVVLAENLEAVVFGHGERLDHRLVNAVSDRTAVIGRLPGKK